MALEDSDHGVYLCEGRRGHAVPLRRGAQRVRVLMLILLLLLLLWHGRWRRQDLRRRHVRIGPAAQRGVAVRVVAQRGALRRGRGGGGGGERRSLSSHGALVDVGPGEAQVGVGLRPGRRRGRGQGAGERGGTRWHRRGGGGQRRRRALLVVADGRKRVAVGRGAGEVVEGGGGRSRRRGLAQETVFFSYVC